MAHQFEAELQHLSAWYYSGLDLADSIDAPELTAVKLRLRNVCNREIGYIHGMLGVARPDRVQETAERKPLTHFFGVPIVFAGNQPVTAADITPTPLERQRFVAEVNDYFASFPHMPIEKLFSKATMPSGEAVIRGVARRAGYDHEGDITEAYLLGLQQAVAARQAQEAAAAGGKKNGYATPTS